MTSQRRIPSHPGRILRLEYLEPLHMSEETLAAHIGVPVAEVQALIRGETHVTPQLAWLLGMATGTGPELWMNLQSNHDLAKHRPKREVQLLVSPA